MFTLVCASPAILLLTGAFYLTYIQDALSYYEIFMISSTNRRVNPQLSTLVDLPYGVISLRGLLVLTLFFYKCHSGHELARQIQILLLLARTVTAINHLPRKVMTYFSRSFLFLTAGGHVISEAVDSATRVNRQSLCHPSGVLGDFGGTGAQGGLCMAIRHPVLLFFHRTLCSIPAGLGLRNHSCEASAQGPRYLGAGAVEQK
ncbi:hypothetical protein BV898_05445 [Hypsibius exemplaris]|uniref:Uncharacterized protein n=1 Tax=Hypsibius exemplaris TaxID=2072580 RepID=A0A1W0WZI9_HYPEX|nr:hypothetical protein BV898_05445 [Hypsibius exemplaris]